MNRNVKPAILSCFGDIASSIGGDFEPSLDIVMQIINEAAGTAIGNTVCFLS
jgi:importin subunit beta-1